MKTCTKIRAIALTLVLALLAAFCGCFMTACKDDNGNGENSDNTDMNAPEVKPLSLTLSVVTDNSGKSVYTINAIVTPATLTPRWVIVWEDPNSDWASGKDVNDYINFELFNGDKTAKLDFKKAFGETAILTATIGQGASAVSVSKKVNYSGNVEILWDHYFEDYIVAGIKYDDICSGIYLTIPSSYNGHKVKSIADSAFKSCKILCSVIIPDSVTTIGAEAFFGCSSLTNVVIPDSVTTIGSEAFRACRSLTTLNMPNSVTSIGTGAFYACSLLNDIKLSNGINQIRGSTFYGCTSLKNVTIPDSVIFIGSSTFFNCSSLVDIVIPSGVTVINSDTFCGCTSLEEIIIPKNITSINKYAFRKCTSLKNITFLGDKSKVYIDSLAFDGCPYQP